MRLVILLLGWAVAMAAMAQSSLETETPAINQIKQSISQRFPQLLPWYRSGVVGLAKDGTVALRDPEAVPALQRQAVRGLVSGENADRAGLYREIARASGNPGWEADIRATFAQRWVEHAPAGWWVQNVTGIWQQK